MVDNSENNVTGPPSASVSTERMAKPVIILFLIVLTTIVVIKYHSEWDAVESVIRSEGNVDVNFKEINNSSANIQRKFEKTDMNSATKVINRQPSCPKSYLLVILQNICTDLVIRNELCTPGDFHNKNKHKIPQRNAKNQTRKEPKVPAIINYAVGGLLLSSVGAALIELYKAKKQTPNKNGKNPLSRKCSLADLTVLKHHRKELIRRESIMEMVEESNHTKQLDTILHPLHRRCSFPAGPNVNNPMNYERATGKRASVLVRQISNVSSGTSLVESRKPSLVVDSRRTSVDSRSADGRRISIDDSPERRHHRLVHRH